MQDNKVFPKEIRMMLDILLREGLGNEGEGANPLGYLEEILQKANFGSEMFGSNFPEIEPKLKTDIAIIFLYDVGLRKLGLDLNQPQMRPDNAGVYHVVPTLKHLENLQRIWTILEKLDENKEI